MAASSNHSRVLERLQSFSQFFSLSYDQASPPAIDDAIRDNVRAAGTNAWVLVAAILIASIGLNVNSTAVIIGAMLISPLMGPIIGLGYGLGVHDQGLIRHSMKVLIAFTAISLLSSTLYFLASPLTEAQPELLARTSPTIWDVMIAFIGGAAGMIGLTRREKTTLIPGVAIATALMPPLCTAGYGLATGQLRFFAGALFLFTINGVFIALATLAITRVLRLPRRANPDEASRQRLRVIIAAAVLITLAPSFVLAMQLVRDELFKARAAEFIAREVRPLADVFLIASDIQPRESLISLTLMGTAVTADLETSLGGRLASYGIPEATMRLLHPSEQKQDLRAESTERTAARAAANAAERQVARIAQLETELEQQRSAAIELRRIEAELRALLDRGVDVRISQITHTASPPDGLYVMIEAPRGLTRTDSNRVLRWLHERMPGKVVHLVVGRAIKA